MSRRGDVEEVMEMVERFMEVNHYYWGLWAIVQARNEGVEEVRILRGVGF